MNFNERQEIIKNEIKSSGLDLHWRIPGGFKDYLSRKFGISKSTIKRDIERYKKKYGIIMSEYKQIIHGENPLREICLDNGLYRSSKQETNVCKGIRMFNSYKLPRGGYGLVIGTPSPICASKLKKLNKVVINDETALIDELVLRCEKTIIVIGNLIDAKKAGIKAILWKRRTTTRLSSIFTAPVTSDTYREWVERYAKTGKWCKVFLLTSGTWIGNKVTEKKYGFPISFQKESLKLSRLYSNLHIIALKKQGYYFEAVHVHNGVERVLADSKDSDHLSLYLSPDPDVNVHGLQLEDWKKGE